MVTSQEKARVEIGRIQRIATKMVPELEDLTYKEKIKEMQLTALGEKRKRRLNYNI